MRVLLCVFLAFFLANCVEKQNAVTERENRTAVIVTVNPEKVYIQRSDAAQHLNFDFILENQIDENLLINKVELLVFDETDKLVRREFYDEYGRRALEIASGTKIEKQAAMMFYNPFHTFTADIPLKRLRYEFSFSSEDRSKYFKTVADVAPVFYETKTDLILPVAGRVLVWDGYDYNSHHRRTHSMESFPAKQIQKANFQRYGYDFVIVDEQGLIYKGAPRVNDDWYKARPDNMEDYYSWGQPIYAAGDGKVVFVQDSKADNRQFDPAELERDERAYGGNYIIIDHLNGEYSWFGHIKQGSALVKVGQTVEQGDVIAAIGASGSSLFPHLHYELRDGSGAKTVEGLPSYFSNFRRLLGSRPVDVEKGSVNTGDIIESPATIKK